MPGPASAGFGKRHRLQFSRLPKLTFAHCGQRQLPSTPARERTRIKKQMLANE